MTLTPTNSHGLSGGGGAATIADGADVTEGAIADAAVVTNAAGTISAKLRGLVALAVAGYTVIGNIASGSADSGNPVKVGGRYNSTKPTFADGQRADAQYTTRGAQLMSLYGADSISAVVVSTLVSDAGDANNSVLYVAARDLLYNGATFDRTRNNEQATLLASAARTVATSSADQTNYNGKGVLIVVNTTVEGAATLTLTVQGKDSISSNYYDLITGIIVYTAAADTPPITRAIAIYPGVLTADAIGAGNANLIAQKSVILPRVWRVTITPADATITTYSVSGVTML